MGRRTCPSNRSPEAVIGGESALLRPPGSGRAVGSLQTPHALGCLTTYVEETTARKGSGKPIGDLVAGSGSRLADRSSTSTRRHRHSSDGGRMTRWGQTSHLLPERRIMSSVSPVVGGTVPATSVGGSSGDRSGQHASAVVLPGRPRVGGPLCQSDSVLLRSCSLLTRRDASPSTVSINSSWPPLPSSQLTIFANAVKRS